MTDSGEGENILCYLDVSKDLCNSNTINSMRAQFSICHKDLQGIYDSKSTHCI
jgi:hypothetical protein